MNSNHKKLNYFTSIKFLSKYISKYKKSFIMFYLGWLFDTVLAIAMPILFGIMIDEIVYYRNVDTFVQISLVFVAMSIYSCVLYFWVYAQHHYLMSMYTFDIKKDIFEHLQKCDARHLTDLSTGDIIATLQNYSSECMPFVTRNIIHVSNSILTILVTITYLFVIRWEIGLFILFAAPLSVIINAYFGKKIRNYGDKQREYYGGYISWVFEMLSALRDIRMLGAQNKTNRIFESKHKEMFGINIKSGISTITADNVISLKNLAVQLGIFALAGYLVVYNSITFGILTIIITFYANITNKMRLVSISYLDVQNRISYIQRIYDFMNSPAEDSRSDKKPLEITNGNIVFHGITFSYNENETVLDGLNLNIKGGERYAVVGKSGCGKTTLAYMLIGFYSAQNGYIEIDGQRLSDCSLASIRRNIGVIQQDVLMLDGTIKENIMLGNIGVSDEEIISACKNAGIWEFIEALPDKLDTIVGTQGIGLSGGQKQRIAIARIYLKNPKIIIFDEATSSLDSETEETIHKAWENILKGRTSIVIAHRQSSVMLCEKAAIIENGAICETGTPSQMIQNSERFKTLFAVKPAEMEAK